MGTPGNDPAGPGQQTATTVVYITGSGRSGSTLLERILGACPGYVNVGELIELFRWVAPEDERCGCGEPFSACPFWQQVGEIAYGGWTPALVAEVAALQRQVARQRRLPLLLAHPRAGRAFSRDVAAYHDHYERLYAAIAEASGAQVVVDASKWPAQGLALTRSPRLDVRLLHLVRDVRGVSFSWAKSGVARPHDAGSRPTMATHPVARTAARWAAFQAEAEITRRVARRSAFLRYEDLVASPATAVARALDQLGLDTGTGVLDHVDDTSADLGTSHGIGGNPSRFRTGRQQLRLDEEWRRTMGRRDRWSTTLIGLPVLARYRYLRS